uniref:Uncharacterized protein n=1 Tax=Leptospira ellisii TaxID=2023197 RepID=A0A2N0BD08_9LEPT|nr:hypothetical protein CH379_02995 [Leptospira ellisii]
MTLYDVLLRERAAGRSSVLEEDERESASPESRDSEPPQPTQNTFIFWNIAAAPRHARAFFIF